MTLTLLSFLGRVPKSENGYRAASYDFGKGARTKPVAFFGWPLADRIAVERMVIMGTAGSMWDHLFEGDIPFGEDAEDARLRLVEATEAKAVTADMLTPLEKPLSDRLGREVRLVLISYCRDEREQVDLLRSMAEHVAPGDAVHIDVTHGFRHLPMIGLLSALHLRVAREAEVAGIWYAPFDPDTHQALVHNLIGLLRIADWVQALHTYDKDADYGVFAPLLRECGVDEDALLKAAFGERINDIGQARGAVRNFRKQLEDLPADSVAGLFRETLLVRTEWAEENKYFERQYALARLHLTKGDYLRAALLGYEAALTRLVQNAPERLDPQNHEHREAVKREYEEAIRRGKRSTRTPAESAFLNLRDLRNALAHGSRNASADVQSALASETALKRRLETLFAQIGPS